MTPTGGRRRLSPRQRKLVLSGVAIAAAVALLGVAIVAIDRARDTDRADARIGVTSAFAQSAAAGDSPVHFSDVTASSGIAMRHGVPQRRRALPEDNAAGLAWGDYDGDGDWDLYLVNHPGIKAPGAPHPTHANRLYRNNGDGTFSDITAQAGVGDPEGFGMGATFIDYDDDGDADLYVTNRGPNRLFQNQGDGTFRDVATAAGVADPLWGTGTAWGDFDRDGFIDFYLCNYVSYDSDGLEPALAPTAAAASSYEAPFTLNPNSYDPQPNRLYRNRGDGTFEDVTVRGDVVNPDGRSLAATFVDLDGDGWLDLYVNNDVSPNRLYRNSGADFGADEPVTFLDLSAVSGTADPRGSMGLSVAEFGDLDGGSPDGLPDLFITHWLTQENALYLSYVTPVGKLEYRDKTRQFNLGEISVDRVGWGSAIVDLDRDGRFDIAVANGSTLEQNADPRLLKPEPLFLFMNDGTTFRDVAPVAGPAAARRYNARGLAAADFDGDGDVDLALACNQGEPVLLRNDTPTSHHSLNLRLRGRAAFAYGARIEVVVAGRQQVRWWGADVSYLSQHAPELVFGLGDAPHADVVRVHWTDGRVSTLTQVPAGMVTVDHATAATVAPAAAN